MGIWIWGFDIILVLAVIAFFIYPRWSLSRNANLVSNEEFTQLSVNGQIIDIREAGEFRVKHITGARNLPASQIDQSLNAVSKNKAVLIYENGRPSQAPKVAKKLKKAGVSEIYILKNGINSWDGKTKTA